MILPFAKWPLFCYICVVGIKLILYEGKDQ
jgi:hypothetical protein